MWRAGESTVLSYGFKVDEASSSLQPLSKTYQVGILISWSLFIYGVKTKGQERLIW